ncbi:uncharacterized protein FOMMEDRAFT_155744 [Fomitiporia mediterranea MF3/22]|uniref:uncharacterized protein n=1 Tax=Fomitiporia mediterranea (strain MF3/22) TaxID=694068 RepID=UPI00044088FC|nr:uncharacterized protein FOMMEDRAFT_155744 [Fomitiporia mediterranea MF3/22]EJD04590.1 hypothetical protein FOMMEDRAFT_155744 [Fomitiporia mediterranea MF3/22]
MKGDLDSLLVIATKNPGDAFTLILKPVLWLSGPREHVDGVADKQERRDSRHLSTWYPDICIRPDLLHGSQTLVR